MNPEKVRTAGTIVRCPNCNAPTLRVEKFNARPAAPKADPREESTRCTAECYCTECEHRAEMGIGNEWGQLHVGWRTPQPPPEKQGGPL